MDIYSRIQSLWEKIKKQGGAERHPTDDAYKPSTDLPLYRHRVVHHHPNAYEVQHRAAEQEYWQDQLRLAKDLNVITKALNTITIWTTVIAGFATLVGFISLYFLWGTLVATETAAVATKDAVIVARETLDFTTRSTHLDKRAWVSLGEIQILDKPTAGGHLGIIVPIQNSGESPAVHTSITGKFSLWRGVTNPTYVPFLKDPGLEECVAEKPKWGDVHGGAIIVPGANGMRIEDLGPALTGNIAKSLMSKKGEKVVLLQEDLDKIPTDSENPPDTHSWRIGLFLVGCINYFDVFHEAHRTSFCYQYDYDPEITGLRPKDSLLACPQGGNDAD